MKKALAITLLALAASTTTATANEIPGTRVSGQGAICAEGQGKAVEVNATTKQESSYCIEIVRPPAPTPEQVETKAKEQVAQTITNQNAQNAPSVTAEETVTVDPRPITEVLTKVEVNATTQETTITELTEAEKEEVAKNRSIAESKQTAKETAEQQASADQGTEYCVNWAAQEQSGTECALDPITATEEEVQDWWSILTETFSDWYEWLSFNWWVW